MVPYSVAFAGIPELLPYKWRGAGLACTEFAMIVPWNFAATYFAYKFLARSWRWCYVSFSARRVLLSSHRLYTVRLHHVCRSSLHWVLLLLLPTFSPTT